MSANIDDINYFNPIAEKNSFEISEITELGGGDINEVFLITTSNAEKLVIKFNNSQEFPGMYEAEKNGLETLALTKTVDIPKVIDLGELNTQSYILLEHKATGKPAQGFWEDFGVNLARLHKNTSKEFGYSQDNYIGSLTQTNGRCESAADFYIKRRLQPQLDLAAKQNFNLGVSEDFFLNISENIPDEPPALIHGDLWNGNFLINEKGAACLFDPAVAYAPREMDLAMMKLFSGFDPKLFSAYNEEFPLERGFEDRLPLWQLYYLLVHLNIFGAGYKNQVLNIIRNYN